MSFLYNFVYIFIFILILDESLAANSTKLMCSYSQNSIIRLSIQRRLLAKAKGYDMLLKILLPTISAVACALCLICYVYTVRSCHLFCSGLTRRLFNKNVRLDLHESTRICGFDINRIVISLVNIEFERIFG